jgi:hypothetical protein
MNPKQILLYQSGTESVNVEVTFDKGNFWLSQKAMAGLFGVDRSVITKHLKNIFLKAELLENSVCAKFAHTAIDGKVYSTQFYRLDAVLAVGYRVNSVQAMQFRKWATETLNEFIIKGFVMDDDRLKQGKSFGQDYFDELLERIREIRNSERRFYQKITDLYALSTDYDKESEQTKSFFGMVQNKLHWAITGKTAAEIIYSELNRIVSAYLDLAENNAQRGLAFDMTAWIKFLDGFLELSNYPILRDKGKITMLEAKLKAETEYKIFRVIQDKYFESDFDQEIKKLQNK